MGKNFSIWLQLDLESGTHPTLLTGPFWVGSFFAWVGKYHIYKDGKYRYYLKVKFTPPFIKMVNIYQTISLMILLLFFSYILLIIFEMQFASISNVWGEVTY